MSCSVGADTYLAEVRARTACRFLVLSRESYFSWFFSGRHTTLARVREVVRTLWTQARRERSYLFLDSDSRFLYFLVTWYEANAGGEPACIPMTPHRHRRRDGRLLPHGQPQCAGL